MWAGGSFEWPAPPGGQPSDSSAPEGMIIGSSIREQTSVAKIEEKRGMVFVHQLKEYSADGGRARPLLKEVRMHVFRQAVQAGRTSEGDQTPKKTSASESSVRASISTCVSPPSASLQKRNCLSLHHPTTLPSASPLPYRSSSVSRPSHSTPIEYTTTPPGRERGRVTRPARTADQSYMDR
jgi:hypothetical protein